MSALGEMIESAHYLYAVLFAAGAYMTYRWFSKEEDHESFNFTPVTTTISKAITFDIDIDFYVSYYLFLITFMLFAFIL